ncbi:helix-turn-helix transcriptional regulator [Ornithinimicrobium cavernae]|uniref:helix-turn-helix transcriptional regulator n=1 Tax=Ornithinimicrobium cavernae TaxID=2666047 RepID=UPI000D68A6A1|nr:helix-turn-helix domain-containing protein [Ornithinimicrobium cavernae]
MVAAHEDPAGPGDTASGPEDPFGRAVSGIASLNEPVRRELYRYVCRRDEPVGREEVAEATGIAHHTVKFHLDRLADDGLLSVDYQRLGGRTGPGAGRPAKVYRASGEEVAVSLPPREYALAGELLAEAVEGAADDGRPVREVLHEVAATRGAALGREAVRGAPVAPDSGAALARVSSVLEQHGYEPRPEGERVVLANCPFHALAQRHTQLVCGMNHAMLEGLTEELAPARLTARLEPAPGRCCVTVAAAGGDEPTGGGPVGGQPSSG